MSVSPKDNTTSPRRYDHDKNEDDGESDIESEDGSDGEKRYEIEKITAQRRNPDGTINYFVQWLNYPPEASTWEPIEHFESQNSLKKVLKESGKVYWVDYNDTIVDGFTIQKWLKKRNNKRYREKKKKMRQQENETISKKRRRVSNEGPSNRDELAEKAVSTSPERQSIKASSDSTKINCDNILSPGKEVLETAKRRLKRGKPNRQEAADERHDRANVCTLNESILTLASPISSSAQQTNIVVQSSILFSSVTDNASTSVCSKSPQISSLDRKQKLERSWAIDKGPPITIENIYDDQFPDDFTYVSNLVFHKSVQPPSPEFLTGCQCDGNCELVQLPPEENENDGIVSTCKCVTMGAGHGEPPYDGSGLVRLEPGYTIYECNALCHCDENCPNKVVQRGRQFELQVFKCFGKKGWGVKTLEFIPARSFVCEYMGEVISHDECEKRGYEGHGMEGYQLKILCRVIDCRTYAFAMDIARGDENLAENNIVYTIDAARKGNVARFINHSCDPNLSQYAVFIESNDVQFHRVGFFAKRDIHAGEELSFDYSGPNQAKRKNKGRAKKRKRTVIMQDEMACLCGSEFCRGTIKL